MSRDKQIGLTVSEERAEEIGRLAAEKGLTVTSWVRMVIYGTLDADKETKEAA